MEQKNKNIVKPVLLIIIILVAISLLFILFSDQKGAIEVNGETVTKSEYDKKFTEAKNILKEISGETDFTDEMGQSLREEILNQLIRTRLIDQYAEENNIVASEEEFDQEYAATISFMGGEEAYQDYLERFDLTEKSFSEDVRREVVFKKSIKNYLGDGEIEVSEEEVQKAYNDLVLEVENAELEEEIPPFESVRNWFINQLRNQKILEEADGFIEYLKSQATIEILI